MSSQHEANILGGCTLHTRRMHATSSEGNAQNRQPKTVASRKTTETILCSHRGHRPAISQAGKQIAAITINSKHSTDSKLYTINQISDSKRLQTFTVDYKRLISG